MSESISALIGVPVNSIVHSKYSEALLWRKIRLWERRNYIMTGAVMGSGDK